jgi:hypothetical protein
MAYGIWDVQGKLIIPGSRKSADFGPVRVCDKDRQTVSKWIGLMLNEKFRRELRGDARFSAHFALMNLRWTDVSGRAKVEASDKAAE